MDSLTNQEAGAAKKLAEAIVEFLIAVEVGRRSRMPTPPAPRVEVKLPTPLAPPAPNAVPALGSTRETPPDGGILVGVREAARLLSVGQRTLWTQTAPRGPIPVVRIGKAVRYAVDDLQTWIKKARQTR